MVDDMFNSDIAVIYQLHKQYPKIEIDLIQPRDISKKKITIK